MSFRVSRCVLTSFGVWGKPKCPKKIFFEREQLEVAKKITKKEGESFFFVFRVATMREIKAPPRPISSIPIVPKKKRKRSCHSHFHCLAHPLSLFFSSSPGKKKRKV